MQTVDIVLRFERMWNDPPLKKWEGLKETDEPMTLGESQAGQLMVVDPKCRDDGEAPLSLELSVPRDFLPKVREAIAAPGHVARVRLQFIAEVFEDSAQAAFADWRDHCTYEIDRKFASRAYLGHLAFHFGPIRPSAKQAVRQEDELTELPTPIATDGPRPPLVPTYGKEIARALTFCGYALAAIAVILLFK
jgi:hypothetical protein